MTRIRRSRPTLSDTVAAIREVVLSAAKKTLQLTGMVPQPQVHLFVDDLDQPFVGYLTVRRFYRGEDAARAIRGLGYAPSTLPASRLLVVWEHADLLTALETPQQARESALVFLDATVDDHSITRYPFEASLGSSSRLGLRWDKPHTTHRPVLPAPIADLLAVWRQFLPDDFEATVEALQQNGYEYASVRR